jgi:cytochrome bd-type quinol oxidase subunit 2
MKRVDWRTCGIMLGAMVVGVAWASYNYTSTGGSRGENQLRPLVWTIFSTPFVLFLGWVLARRREGWLAAFVCFCIYFFTPFVAARIESFVVTAEQAAQMGHHIYFSMVMVLHGSAALAVSIWRSLQPATSANDSLLAINQQPFPGEP